MTKVNKKSTETPEFLTAKDFVSTVKKEVDQSVDLVKKFEITNQSEYSFAENALHECAKKHDELDKKRKSWVDPLNKVIKDINATFKPVLVSLKDAEATLKQKLGDYVLAQETKRKELLAEISEEPDRALEIIEHAEEYLPPTSQTASAKIEWSGEVINADLIPREYLVPDLKKLQAITKAFGKDPEIPGWRAFEVANIRTSRE